ncbi:MAG: adenylyltransferase/cytidyltransferase family protein [Candidatus Paceibacterota bacterium]
MKTAIFSGRFDPVHLGHVLTILKLLDRFDRVVVVILDYPEREGCTAQEAFDIFQSVFIHISSPRMITLIINKDHFATISREQYLDLIKTVGAKNDGVVYVSGNRKVLDNFQHMDLPWEYIPRSREYSGTEERRRIHDAG